MINHIIFDVDGTLTDGGLFVANNGMEFKQFSVKDGLIISVLPKLGFTTMFVTGRISKLTDIRAEDLHICKVFQGVNDKAGLIAGYMEENKLGREHFAYMGDDLNDIAAMNLCAFKACPSDAAKEVKDICDYIATQPGGCGAAREVCEILLHRQNKYENFKACF